MNKKHYDTIWNDLTPEQKATLREWLLEQNLGYDDVLERIGLQWGIKTSKASLCRYYQSLQRERLRADLSEVKSSLKAAQGAKLDLGKLQEGVLTMMAKKVVKAALEDGDTKDLARLTNLLLEHGQQEIQRAWLKLTREKFQFNSAEAALKALPMADQIKSEDLEREKKRIEAIKLKIYGKDLIEEIIE